PPESDEQETSPEGFDLNEFADSAFMHPPEPQGHELVVRATHVEGPAQEDPEPRPDAQIDDAGDQLQPMPPPAQPEAGDRTDGGELAEADASDLDEEVTR